MLISTKPEKVFCYFLCLTFRKKCTQKLGLITLLGIRKLLLSILTYKLAITESETVMTFSVNYGRKAEDSWVRLGHLNY